MAERLKGREQDILHDLASHMPMQEARGSGSQQERLAETRYTLLSRGHEAPALVVRTARDGQAHTLGLDAESRGIIRTRRHSRTEFQQSIRMQIEGVRSGTRSEARREGEEGRVRRQVSEALENAAIDAERAAALEKLAPMARENTRISEDIRTAWMTEEFLGSDIYRRFGNSPPFLTTEPDSFFNRREQAFSETDSWGYCFWDTNHILISGKVTDETQRYHVITHEQLHYASWLGGGTEFRYRGAGGEPVIVGSVGWLHEGLTELHAQHLMRANGRTPLMSAYEPETAFCRSLELFVSDEAGSAERGSAIMRRAYLSGDLSEVRALVDSRLGSGTFDVIMGRADAPGGGRIRNGTEALAFFLTKMDSAGVNYSAWRDDPIIRLTGIGLR